MLKSLKIFYAFLRKDFLIAYSYRTNFFISVLTVFFLLFILSNLSKLSLNNGFLGDFADNSFGYFVIGFAIIDLAMTISSRGAAQARELQLTGVFEELLLFRRSNAELMVSLFIYPTVFALFRFLLILIFSVVFFDLQINNLGNFTLLILVMSLSIMSFVGIGLISAFFIIILKKGDFVNSINLILCIGFGNIIFPSEIVDTQLSQISYFLPITYSVELLRELLIGSISNESISANLTYLLGLSFFFIGLGIISCQYAIKFAKIRGSLGEF